MNEMNLINQTYTGSHEKSGLYDIHIVDTSSKSLVLFMHGYMGFKDWGCWNLVQKHFIESGFNFCKYNITHGGTTLENTTDFVDITSFSENSYLREYEDCNAMIQHLNSNFEIEEIHLIGHSRGGGIALLMHSHPRVKSITTWAAIATIEGRMKSGEELEAWKKNGVYFIKNGRTHQEMPHSYSAYEEFEANRDLLSIENQSAQCTKPLCIIHGENDTSVSIDEGRTISKTTGVDLITIPTTNHTFDSRHPWNKPTLPVALLQVCEKTITFIQSIN